MKGRENSWLKKVILYLFQDFMYAKHLYTDTGRGGYLLFGNPDWLEKSQEKNGLQILDGIISI